MLIKTKISFNDCAHIYELNKNDLQSLADKKNIKELNKDFLINNIIPIVLYISKQLKENNVFKFYISGGQGSGKSTISDFIKFLLINHFNCKVASFSIDDIYLSKKQRIKLSNEVHPLLSTRGVPGTHDISLGLDTINSLESDADKISLIPKFSKKFDDLLPKSMWKKFEGTPEVIIFDGWCVGAIPEAAENLKTPINSLEREFDPNGIWVNWVNDNLSGIYQDLFNLFDLKIYIKSPSFEKILENRWLQEKTAIEMDKSRSKSKYMTKQEVYNFVMHFERITKDMEKYMPKNSDIVVERKNKLDFEIQKPDFLNFK